MAYGAECRVADPGFADKSPTARLSSVVEVDSDWLVAIIEPEALDLFGDNLVPETILVVPIGLQRWFGHWGNSFCAVEGAFKKHLKSDYILVIPCDSIVLACQSVFV
jgi:hypothetical protein